MISRCNHSHPNNREIAGTDPIDSIVIIGAVMTKLLHMIYGVLKSGKPFNPKILKYAEITF